MLNWGGEYLDLEWYYEPSPQPEPQPEPWRQHRLAPQCVLVPRQILLSLAQGPRLVEVGRDWAAIAEIRVQLENEGLREPLELVIDRDGRIVLRDGHHRILATDGMGQFDYLPVLITRSDRGIAVSCTTVYEILPALLSTVRAS